MTSKKILKSAHTILVIDWPSMDVPEFLALSGFHVIVKGGPGPEDYSTYEVTNGKVTPRRTGRSPDRADIVYSYRPLSELAEIIAQAKALGAKTIWSQSGRTTAGTEDPQGCWLPEEEIKKVRDLVEAAGVNLITHLYIVDAVRELQSARP